MKRTISNGVAGVCVSISFLFLVYSGSVCADSILKDQVNIRSGPSMKSDVSFRAPLGYPIKIEKVQGDWVYFCDWENNRGWIHKPLVSKVKTAVILVTEANLRSSGSTKSKVVAIAKRGEIYKVLTTKGEWIQLGYFFGGDPVGWVRSDLVFTG